MSVSALPKTSLCPLCVGNTTLTVAAVDQRTPFANKLVVANQYQVTPLPALLAIAGGKVWLHHGGMHLMAHRALGLQCSGARIEFQTYTSAENAESEL